MATIKKFRVWDVSALNESLEHVLQISDNINSMLASVKNPEELPDSLVPTSMLYDIAVCYEAMYNKLLDESLIVTGNNRKISKTIH